MVNRLKNVFLYNGLDEYNYERIVPNITSANRTMIRVFSGIACTVVLAMFTLSFFVVGVEDNRWIYFFGMLLSLILFLAATFANNDHPKVINFLVHVVYCIFFTYGIFIGTITNPEQQTVTFIVMLVFLPVLFIETPKNLFLSVIFYVLVFITLCIFRKSDTILSVDIMDSLIYGIVGATSGSIVNHIKVNNYKLTRMLHEIGRSDQMTQLNNRNAFELDLDDYPNKFRNLLGCIYIDVNGLHELNNTEGHEAGDAMLKYVAKSICEVFDCSQAYRVGGDEFVVFTIDEDRSGIETKIKSFLNSIEEHDYHAAIGYEVAGRNGIRMKCLVKAAEGEMYKAKNIFYRGNERQARN